ncbi:MAG: hypothetical protein R2717_07105 [Schumannella sp.]|nr:hypothetical protein [Microbacteriaceae bacterium]
MSAVLIRSLRYGAVIAVAVALVAGVIGYLVAGGPGVVGALLGALVSAVFLGLTAGSMLVARRVVAGDGTDLRFFVIVVAVLGVKLVVFLVLMIWLRGQEWLDLAVFGWTMIVSVAGTLAADVVAFTRTRFPYVSDVRLPGDPGPNP